MKKIKLIKKDIDLNTIIGISQYCNFDVFKKLFYLNKFINNKIKTGWIDNNITFVFKKFPNEPLRYVKILRIKYNAILYFSYLKSENILNKFSDFFHNLREVQITERFNMERQPNIEFFLPFRPLPEYVDTIVFKDVTYCEEANNIITKNVKKLTLDNVNLRFGLNFKNTNIEVLKIWGTTSEFGLSYNHWFPETLVKLKIDLRMCGFISINDEVRDIFCLPNLKKIDMIVYLNQIVIDLSLSKVESLIINYDMNFRKPVSYVTMENRILNNSNYLKRFEVRFQKDNIHYREYFKLSNTIIKNNYENKIVNLKEIIVKDEEKIKYIEFLKSKINNVKTIFYFMCTENRNVFSYLFL